MVTSVKEVGCCGAYCRTCRALQDGTCRGCKLGYAGQGRDLVRARCRIKVCCLKDRGLETCADCASYPACEIIQGFYARNSYKYKRYQRSIAFIREKGYPLFIALADGWKGPYGKLG
jgi:hypothetical protein